MYKIKLFVLFILVFINCWKCFICLNVNIREYDGAKFERFKTKIFKRDMAQFFDKASYSFNGFEKLESVPVLFPIDICILKLDGVKYAATLHANKNGVRHFAVFKLQNQDYQQLSDIETPLATAMDCWALGSKGYVAIVFNITTPIENAKNGSPIYEIAGDRLRAVQYFPNTNLYSVYLRASGNDLFLLQTYQSTAAKSNLECPYYKWSGSTFNRLDRIPCSNARHLEPFSIDYEIYVAVANYPDHHGRTAINSEIYKFNKEKRKFQIFQKIKTNGAVDVRYFSVPFDEAKKQHFLIFGNSLSSKKKPGEEKNFEADSVFYIFDKGQFVPYQSLSLYAVEHFLPIKNEDSEKFLLLVSCNNQDTKIYNFNDWKFEESETQFTEGALGRGVANMRVYQENENSYLVIANELMTDNDTNIFRPIFKQDEHANALRQQIIEWSKANLERLGKMDMGKLKQNVEEKLAKFRKTATTIKVKDIPNSNIQTAITRSLVYPQLHFTSNYWKALSFANQALDALHTEFADKIIQKRQALDNKFENSEYELDHANFGTLIVRDQLKVANINEINVEKPTFKKITAKRVEVAGKYNFSNAEERKRVMLYDRNVGSYEISYDHIDVMKITNLQIDGKLNGYTWDDLMNNTLKRDGLQFVKSPARISTLIAKTLVVASDEINRHNIDKLISIDGGDYVVNQDVQFAAPIIAKNVVINDRLNNIHVRKGKLDVLLKRANKTQVVTGSKMLDNIKVLEPITIAGRMLGRHLRSISPTKAIHDDIILHGDYRISGDVAISKLLNAKDMIVSDMSVQSILQNGIRLNQSLEDVNLKFQQPIEVNESMVSFVNAVDLQQLVKLNIDDIQVVEGEKVFNKNLEIRKGFSEVKYLNGIDVEHLDEEILMKHTNQTITAFTRVGKIITKRVDSPTINLNDKKLSKFLTKTSNQHINGTLHVDNLETQTMDTQNLNANYKIFNTSLSDIYQRRVKINPHADIFQSQRKFNGSIFVKNLKINTTINGRSVAEIERQLWLLNGDIKYVGDYKFNHDMNLSSLTFGGSLNGIPAADFGRNWLQKTGAQSFIAPQTLSTIKCENGILLEGLLNGFKMEDFFVNTYWINRDEQLNSVIFQNPIVMQRQLSAKSLNGLQVPADCLYSRSLQPQVIHTNVILQQDLQINGSVFNTSIVNGINLLALERYLNDLGADTLHVENAHFTYAPQYKTLNRHNIKNMLDSVWLANENVNLNQHVEISEAHFKGLLDFEGPINNLDLNYLKENYLSLSRPQDITTQLIFTDDVKFENTFNANDVQIFGPVIETKSNVPLNFDEFVSNTLKKSGPHEIRGIWSIPEVNVQGHLNDVHINNLNLFQDVVQLDKPFTEISAPKRINTGKIQKLYASPFSTVNEVGVSNWIRDSVTVYDNHTIQGVTTIDTINLYNNLQVEGKVNNLTFAEHTLLLRDLGQTIRGDVVIRNKFPEKQKILVNNFENLHADSVNGVNLTKFFTNRGKLTKGNEIKSHLIFTQPVVVQEYHNTIDEEMPMKWKRRTNDNGNMNTSLDTERPTDDILQKFVDSFQEPFYMLDHFEIRQSLAIQADKIIPFSLHLENTILDIIAVWNESERRLQYYRWHQKEEEYVVDEDLYFLPQDKTSIDLLKLWVLKENSPLTSVDYRNTEYYTNQFANALQLQKIIQKQHQNISKINFMKFQQEICFPSNHNSENQSYFQINCLQEARSGGLEIYEKFKIQHQHIKQLLSLSNVTLALLSSSGVEIWCTHPKLEFIQKLPFVQPKQMAMAMGVRNNITFLAVITEMQNNSLHHGSIDILSSKDGMKFQHLQSIDCNDPIQLEFVALHQTDDLLLLILTKAIDKPLVVFQFKGVMGFENIMDTSVLPLAKSMGIIELKSINKYLVALATEHKIIFVEITYKKF